MSPRVSKRRAPGSRGGRGNLRAAIVDRTSPDGAWDTHSISYQTVSVPWAARVLEFLDANPGAPGVDELAAMVKRQEGKLLGAPLWVVMPNGGLSPTSAILRPAGLGLGARPRASCAPTWAGFTDCRRLREARLQEQHRGSL